MIKTEKHQSILLKVTVNVCFKFYGEIYFQARLKMVEDQAAELISLARRSADLLLNRKSIGNFLHDLENTVYVKLTIIRPLTFLS